MVAALAVAWASTPAAQTAGKATALPTTVTSMLDARFPGWSIAPASEDSLGGRGIPLMSAVTDDFELRPELGGTRVRFGKRCVAAAA